MPILRQMLGRLPNGPKTRVRNFIANARLGTKVTTIHENVISPGVVVPSHTHAIEEVIVVLSGEGECRTENGTQAYSVGDVLIFPAGVKLASKFRDGAAAAALYFPSRPENAATGSGKHGSSGRNLQYVRVRFWHNPATPVVGRYVRVPR